MILSPIEQPQYIVAPPTDCEMKDIIGYHNKHLTGKISNYTAFLKNADICYLLFYNNNSDLKLKILRSYLK